MKKLRVETAVNGISSNSIQQSDDVVLADLLAGTNKTVPVPEDATKVMYQFYGGDVLYARHGGAAFTGVPAASDTPQAVMADPDMRTIEAGQTEIHVISASAGRCVLNFYGG